MHVSWRLRAFWGGHASIRNTTEIRKNKLVMVTACRLVDVARLMSTPGVYVGVSVRSDEAVSGPATPSAPSSFRDFSSCLRAATDLKVGSAIANDLAF